jgi:hypothetical protein
MKFCATIIFLTFFAFTASAQREVKLKDARKHLGKRITITATLCDWINVSKTRSAWLYLGSDSLHKQLQMEIQGDLYYKFDFDKNGGGSNWIGIYRNKTITITGWVKGNNDEVYLEASSAPVLSSK